jgi:hypothetical protein
MMMKMMTIIRKLIKISALKSLWLSMMKSYAKSDLRYNVAVMKLYTMQTKHNANISLVLEQNTNVTDMSCRPVIVLVLINKGGKI